MSIWSRRRPSGATETASQSDTPSLLATLYRAHWHELCRFVASRFGAGPPAPEDVAQLAFLRLATREDLSEIREPRAFLRVAARNIVLSERRGQLVRVRNTEEIQGRFCPLGGDDRTPERAILAREQIAVVSRVLQSMPARRRRVLVLNRIEGLSFAEIARRLGLSPTAVKKHAARAMADLDAALSEPE
ncbi:MAG: RNA polymerase sigma factor [Pseudomonadota bacterium]